MMEEHEAEAGFADEGLAPDLSLHQKDTKLSDINAQCLAGMLLLVAYQNTKDASQKCFAFGISTKTTEH